MEGFEPVYQGCFGVLKIATLEGVFRFLGCHDLSIPIGSMGLVYLPT